MFPAIPTFFIPSFQTGPHSPWPLTYATPDEKGDEGSDLNDPPANEQDMSIREPLEANGAGEIKRGESLPALLLQHAV